MNDRNSSAHRWVDGFFSGLVIESLRRIYPEPVTRAETDFILRTLTPNQGASVLDVPCGNGRLTLNLAEKGLNATGMDLCSELLDDARRGAAERKLSATFEHRDMRDIPRDGTFDHVICMGNSFGYLGDEGDLAYLQAVRDALAPTGTFLIETHFIAESLFPQPLQRRWYQFGDLYFLHESAYDPAESQLQSTYTLIRNGEVEIKKAWYPIRTFREFHRLLSEAGLEQLRSIGAHSGEPFRLGSPGLWVVAKRR